jgi:hypothetical protein
VTPPLIKDAVTCPHWKAYIKTIKHRPPQVRLELMANYSKPRAWNNKSHVAIVLDAGMPCCDNETRAVQVIHYIRLMRRAGLIDVPDRRWMNVDDVHRWLAEYRYVVLK